MKKVVVVGAGAAGCMAAISASKNGSKVILLEKNNMIGKKIRITGKGRCNITNSGDIEDIMNNIYKNRNFMYSSLYTYTNENLMRDLQDNGLEIKVERGNRVFPKSDKAIDVVIALEKMMSKEKVEIRYNSIVKELIIKNDESKDKKYISGVVLKNGERIYCDSVIVATGGKSYPKTGANGDGYKILSKVGHKITDIKPALVGMEVEEEIKDSMVGLLLKNIGFKLYQSETLVYEDFGELEYRKYGIDGATVKSASCHYDIRKKGYIAVIDLKPALSKEKLDNRIQRDFKSNMNSRFEVVLKGLLPMVLVEEVSKRCKIPLDKTIHQITREERYRLIDVLKNFSYRITSLRSIDEAIITDGGVELKEINPSTMESKLIEGLYIAGEILDVEGYTGGYNLQIAFSTGYLAGMNV